MVEIEVQKARQGDCIWLRCVADDNISLFISHILSSECLLK